MPPTAKAKHLREVLRPLPAGPARAPRRPPYTVGFYLVANFPMMAFAAAIEPLRAANRLSGEKLFDWRLFSRDGEPVRASNGIGIAAHGSIRDAPVLDLLLVCAGAQEASLEDRIAHKWLRDLDRASTISPRYNRRQSRCDTICRRCDIDSTIALDADDALPDRRERAKMRPRGRNVMKNRFLLALSALATGVARTGHGQERS